jgi:hypothetical protein
MRRGDRCAAAARCAARRSALHARQRARMRPSAAAVQRALRGLASFAPALCAGTLQRSTLQAPRLPPPPRASGRRCAAARRDARSVRVLCVGKRASLPEGRTRAVSRYTAARTPPAAQSPCARPPRPPRPRRRRRPNSPPPCGTRSAARRSALRPRPQPQLPRTQNARSCALAATHHSASKSRLTVAAHCAHAPPAAYAAANSARISPASSSVLRRAQRRRRVSAARQRAAARAHAHARGVAARAQAGGDRSQAGCGRRQRRRRQLC